MSVSGSAILVEHRPALRAAADLLTRYPFAFWTWGDSIGFEGLLAASDLLADGTYAGWVHGAFKGWAGFRRPFREQDNTAPGHAMCLASERTGDDALLGSAEALANFLQTRRRLPSGVFISGERALLRPPYGDEVLPAEEVALLDDPGAAVYVDAIHMDPPLYAHLGALREEPSLVDLGADQLMGHLELLQDEDTGLLWHFFLERTGRRYCHGWGRGQGWALLGTLDVLEHLPTDDPRRAEIEHRFSRIAAGLRDHQRADGGWRAVVDDPAAESETSTSAFAAIAFLRGVRQGLLPAEFTDDGLRAWEHALRHVDGSGMLTGVSVAVEASTRPSHYRHVPIGGVVPWGQGPLLAAAHTIAEEGAG